LSVRKFLDKILVATNIPDFIVLDAESLEFEYDHYLKDVFKHRSRYHFYRDHQHSLWIGGLDGMFKYSLPQLKFRSWLYDHDKKNTLSGGSFTSVIKSKYNKLWIGSTDGGLDKIDLSNNMITHIGLPPDMLKMTGSGSIFSIIPVHEETLLLNYWTALLKYDVLQDSFSFFNPVNIRIYTFFFRESYA
jgi:hypothetical protein